MRAVFACMACAMGLLGGGVAAASDTAPPPPATAAPAPDPATLLSELEQALDALLALEPYDYRSTGSRDPFLALITTEGEPARDGLVGIDELIIVGVAWGAEGMYALAETANGRSLILHEGDPIRNGRILEITAEGVVARHSHYGVTRTVTLPIATGEEERDES